LDVFDLVFQIEQRPTIGLFGAGEHLAALAGAELTQKFGCLDVGAQDLDFPPEFGQREIELPASPRQRIVAYLELGLLLLESREAPVVEDGEVAHRLDGLAARGQLALKRRLTLEQL